MTAFLAKWCGVNWTTNIPGTVSALCGLSVYFEMLPSRWRDTAMAFCGLMLSWGVIAAKSANVSNSPDPREAVVVPPAAAVKPNPAAVVAPCLALLFLVGCSTTKDPGMVLMKLSADRQSVLVAGCSGMADRHVEINALAPAIAPLLGQYALPAAGALAIETVAATALCAQVQAMPTVQAPFVPAPIAPAMKGPTS